MSSSETLLISSRNIGVLLRALCPDGRAWRPGALSTIEFELQKIKDVFSHVDNRWKAQLAFEYHALLSVAHLFLQSHPDPEGEREIGELAMTHLIHMGNVVFFDTLAPKEREFVEHTIRQCVALVTQTRRAT